MKELEPLQSTLDAILSRLAQLETKVGVTAPPLGASAGSTATGGDSSADDVSPAVAGYQSHMTKAGKPFIDACTSISGLKDTGANIQTIWDGIGAIILLASKCKKPTTPLGEALSTQLKPIQDAVASVRSKRLDRKYDWHIKGIMEMLVSVSWVVMSAPPAPSSFIKETIGSSDFWSNKIRKEYKLKKDDPEAAKHIAFCDTMKALILDLADYAKEFHMSGLFWNPRGIPIEDYKGSDDGSSSKTSAPTPAPTKPIASSKSPGDVMNELAKRRSTDGTSAATGLKKVSRDQQTWRKEYKATSATSPVPSATVKPSQVKASQKAAPKKMGQPVCRYQEVGCKWFVEYQSETSNPNGLCTIEVKSPKDQIYIFKAENATIHIKGKVKSIIVDSAFKSNVIFESAISSCETVNCKKVQIQSTGLCPSFSIDKTDGCLVYLSKEAVPVTNFVTTKSSEMNVSWEDEAGEVKECPIPEQFVHKLVDGSITSDVSDLYH